MKWLFTFLLLVPLALQAQNKDTAHAHKPFFTLPEGYADISLVNELWVISKPMAAGYSTITYRGPGYYFGGGVKSRNSIHQKLGYSLGVDYLQYNMGHSLNVFEQSRTNFSFLRVAPAVNFYLKEISKITFNFNGGASLLVPLQDNERVAYEFNIKGCVGYKAYELNVGYNFCPKGLSPEKDIHTSGWHEQMFTVGFAVYPYRIPAVVSHFTGNLWKKQPKKKKK